jgi:cytoskeletal protein CcmA (bactofilin family)
MWNKSAEAKSSPQASDTPAQASATPKITPKLPGTQVDPIPAVVAPPVSAALSSPQVSSSVTTIAAGIKITGEFLGNSDLHVDGEALGRIRLLNSRVTVGPNGSVQADVEAREIVVDGTVQGNLKASERIRLGAKSRVQGSIVTPRIAIEDGARLRGKVEMLRAGETRIASADAKTDSGATRAASAGAKGE